MFVFLKDDKKEAWQIMIEDPVNVCEKKNSKARILKKKAKRLMSNCCRNSVLFLLECGY